MLLLGLVHLSTPLGPWTSWLSLISPSVSAKIQSLRKHFLGLKQPFTSLNRGLLYFILITVIFRQFLEYLTLFSNCDPVSLLTSGHLWDFQCHTCCTEMLLLLTGSSLGWEVQCNDCIHRLFFLTLMSRRNLLNFLPVQLPDSVSRRLATFISPCDSFSRETLRHARVRPTCWDHTVQ